MNHLAHGIATVFGVGKLPVAPGTWGSLVAGLVWYFSNLADYQDYFIGLTLLVIIIGIWSGSRYAQAKGHSDPSEVVIDEWAGQWIALWFVPQVWFMGGMAFILFRVFDIAKPWPIRKLETVSGSWGIMLDDLAAGIFALIGTHLLGLFLL